MDKQKTGRPKGTTKDGIPTPQKQLDKLRTKAWAWCCAYFKSKEPGKHAGLDLLARSANEYAFSERKKLASYDGTGWSRWRSGKIAARPSTVLNLWEEVHGAYFQGPWADGQELIGPNNFGGGFVPLWSALAPDPQKKNTKQKSLILEDWQKVSNATWEEWAPLDDFPEVEPEGGHMYPGSDQNYLPGLLRNIHYLHPFATRLAAAKKSVPPLLCFAAALTVTRLNDDKKIWLFEPESRGDYSIPPYMRPLIIDCLKEINISLGQIINVAHAYGLHIIDCGEMSYQEYKSLKWPRSSKFRGLITGQKLEKNISIGDGYYEPVEINEKDWRAFFETPCPKE